MPLRVWIRAHCPCALLVLALALAMKMLVPAGFMVSSSRVLTIEICTESLGTRTMQQITVGADKAAHQADSAKAAMAKKPCTFAGHSAALMGGADAWLLAGALAFILLLGFAPVHRPRLARVPWLLPPPSGPPAFA